MAACLLGDQRAWSELVERYGRLVWSVARQAGLGQADSDDVLQTVFLALHRHLPSLRDHASLASWLITTTRREASRVRRSLVASRIAASQLDRTAESLAAASPHRESLADLPDGEDTEDLERRCLVRLALRRLGGRCERLLSMLFLSPGQPSYESIADLMDMPIGSIGPTRARCFRRLEAILVELGVAPPEASGASGASGAAGGAGGTDRSGKSEGGGAAADSSRITGRRSPLLRPGRNAPTPR